MRVTLRFFAIGLALGLFFVWPSPIQGPTPIFRTRTVRTVEDLYPVIILGGLFLSNHVLLLLGNHAGLLLGHRIIDTKKKN
jgi:hypothetical protein